MGAGGRQGWHQQVFEQAQRTGVRQTVDVWLLGFTSTLMPFLQPHHSAA